MYANEILLVEDDLTDASFFRRAVTRLEDPPRLSWCKNAHEALENLAGRTDEGNYPRLAVIDIKMPGMNGLELLAKLRSQKTTKDLPVIMMSGSDEPRDIQDAYKIGTNSYVVKPNKFQELRELVESINHFWVKTNRLRPVRM